MDVRLESARILDSGFTLCCTQTIHPGTHHSDAPAAVVFLLLCFFDGRISTDIYLGLSRRFLFPHFSLVPLLSIHLSLLTPLSALWSSSTLIFQEKEQHHEIQKVIDYPATELFTGYPAKISSAPGTT